MMRSLLLYLAHNKIFLVLFGIGVFTRFYSLGWGEPFFFHPDERNIAYGVTNLAFPDEMNPKFFAYGSLPIYVIYLLGVVWNSFEFVFQNSSANIFSVPFEKAILVSRFCSATLSSLLLFFIYKFCVAYFSKAVSHAVLFLSVFSVGFVQYAHFGTFEMWLSFFSFLLLYFVVLYVTSKKCTYYFYSCLLLGVLVSVKMSSLVFAPFVLGFGIVPFIISKKSYSLLFYIKKLVRLTIGIGAVVGVVFFVTNPFSFFDFSSFYSSIEYEYLVANGTLQVFYTGGFVNTTPILFHVFRVFPFLVNPFVSLLFFVLFPFSIYRAFSQKNIVLGLIIVFFLISFLSQSFLYVKWTRYMVPSISFLYVIFGYILYDNLSGVIKNKPALLSYLYSTVGFLSFLFFVAFFVTVYLRTDTRIDAYQWAKINIPSSSHLVTEPYDLGILPFNSSFSHITIANFYELDTGQLSLQSVQNLLEDSDYIVLPSQRILRNRVLHPDVYSESSHFYSDLFEKYSYELVYKTTCDAFCQIAYFGSPVFWLEETSSVFDRPSVYILKKKL